jgi:hypothetical protein
LLVVVDVATLILAFAAASVIRFDFGLPVLIF